MQNLLLWSHFKWQFKIGLDGSFVNYWGNYHAAEEWPSSHWEGNPPIWQCQMLSKWKFGLWIVHVVSKVQFFNISCILKLRMEKVLSIHTLLSVCTMYRVMWTWTWMLYLLWNYILLWQLMGALEILWLHYLSLIKLPLMYLFRDIKGLLITAVK
jgi:hypothetical protein